jgi:hypothetical protein
MRSRAGHLACLLLLLSSLAVSDVRSGSAEPARTPGGVFVRNLLLQAAVEEHEPATSGFVAEETSVFTAAAGSARGAARSVSGAAEQSAHVHAVTGNSL